MYCIDFFAETDKLSLLAKYCELREYPNQFVTTNMWMVKPKDIVGKYDYVFVLLDDIKLHPSQTKSPSQNPSQTKNPSQNPSQSSIRQLNQFSRRLQTTSSSTTASSSTAAASSTSSLSVHMNKKRLKTMKFFDLSLLLSIMERNNLTAARLAIVVLVYCCE